MSETPHTLVNPADLGPTAGFSHGVLARPGRSLYIAGQVGADSSGAIVAGGFVAQFDVALRRIVTVLHSAGGAPEHVVSMTIYDDGARRLPGSACRGRRRVPATLRRALPGDGAGRGHRAGRQRRGGGGQRRRGDPSTSGARTVNIVVAGGGPGGLLFAILARLSDAANSVEVLERNRSDDPFGFGVVFSDETLTNLRGADPTTFAQIEAEMRYWTEIDIDLGGRTMKSGGHGFAALERRRLLAILSERALAVGVRVRYSSPATDSARMRAEHDLVVAADG